VVQRFRRQQRGVMGEMICAENNFNPFNFDVYPIPEATRPDF
jgi:hypothetical protein